MVAKKGTDYSALMYGRSVPLFFAYSKCRTVFPKIEDHYSMQRFLTFLVFQIPTVERNLKLKLNSKFYLPFKNTFRTIISNPVQGKSVIVI